MTRALFEHTYGGVRADAYVLRVNQGGATLTRLPRDADVARALSVLLQV